MAETAPFQSCHKHQKFGKRRNKNRSRILAGNETDKLWHTFL